LRVQARGKDGRYVGQEKREVAEGVVRLEKPLKPSQCRSYMRRELAAKYPDIVAGFLKGAESGSCAHVKLAGELLEEPEKKPRQKKGSATRLLEELMKSEKAAQR
jgi:hypothetical protein